MTYDIYYGNLFLGTIEAVDLDDAVQVACDKLVITPIEKEEDR